MKPKFDIKKKELLYFVYFLIGTLILLEVFFYKSGFLRILIISLKLSFLIHLPGYLIALKIFKEEFDLIGILFIGLALGLIVITFFYYGFSLFGFNITGFTYIVPIMVALIGIIINLKKSNEKELKKVNEIKIENK
ncbi:hypothetical protein HN385_01390 [archaeon]|jgi:hypothetical protein|nr:hypothetical protein [archaeon]MBT3451335.1 hypothetical protein [archaeon]MBT6869349.1 hypothetical protein [archaeon]MBT7192512.1 hypothetical protein [archaeon]MBT7380588.1 hypothetical protein [archaeon]